MLVLAEEKSDVTIIEDHIGLSDNDIYDNSGLRN